jgi:hypothetical protein
VSAVEASFAMLTSDDGEVRAQVIVTLGLPWHAANGSDRDKRYKPKIISAICSRS